MIFQTPELAPRERAVLDRIEALRRTLAYAVREPRRWTGLLRRNMFALAIRGSNTIEGYVVTVDDAVAALEGEGPFDADAESWAAVRGYQQAMTYVLQLATDPHFAYSTDLLRSLHFMMLSHDLSKSPGQWRPGPINVRDEEKGVIVYEGPDAEAVPGFMDELVAGLQGEDDTADLVRAAMAHLNLVTIHPFRDGNGRMARGLQTLVLARGGILAPPFSSIEEYLGRNTRSYYDVLAEVGGGGWQPRRDARPWIRYCLTAHFRQATTLLRRTKEMHRLWDALETEVKRRGLPERVLLALADAAVGHRVRNATYRGQADISDQLASRDLKALADIGLLVPHGERRGRYYVAAESILAIRAQTREPKSVEDPFGDSSS